MICIQILAKPAKQTKRRTNIKNNKNVKNKKTAFGQKKKSQSTTKIEQIQPNQEQIDENDDVVSVENTPKPDRDATWTDLSDEKQTEVKNWWNSVSVDQQNYYRDAVKNNERDSIIHQNVVNSHQYTYIQYLLDSEAQNHKVESNVDNESNSVNTDGLDDTDPTKGLDESSLAMLLSMLQGSLSASDLKDYKDGFIVKIGKHKVVVLPSNSPLYAADHKQIDDKSNPMAMMKITEQSARFFSTINQRIIDLLQSKLLKFVDQSDQQIDAMNTTNLELLLTMMSQIFIDLEYTNVKKFLPKIDPMPLILVGAYKPEGNTPISDSKKEEVFQDKRNVFMFPDVARIVKKVQKKFILPNSTDAAERTEIEESNKNVVLTDAQRTKINDANMYDEADKATLMLVEAISEYPMAKMSVGNSIKNILQKDEISENKSLSYNTLIKITDPTSSPKILGLIRAFALLSKHLKKIMDNELQIISKMTDEQMKTLKTKIRQNFDKDLHAILSKLFFTSIMSDQEGKK